MRFENGLNPAIMDPCSILHCSPATSRRLTRRCGSVCIEASRPRDLLWNPERCFGDQARLQRGASSPANLPRSLPSPELHGTSPRSMAMLISSARAAVTQAIPTPLQGRTIQLPTPRQHIETASFIHQSLLTLI